MSGVQALRGVSPRGMSLTECVQRYQHAGSRRSVKSRHEN